MGTDVRPAERRWRARASQPRGNKSLVSFTDEEFEAVRAGAQASGLSVAGYVAECALAAARNTAPPVTRAPHRETVAELHAARAALNQVGNNLNQSVTALNAVGRETGNLEAYASYIARVAHRMDSRAQELIDGTTVPRR